MRGHVGELEPFYNVEMYSEPAQANVDAKAEPPESFCFHDVHMSIITCLT